MQMEFGFRQFPSEANQIRRHARMIRSERLLENHRERARSERLPEITPSGHDRSAYWKSGRAGVGGYFERRRLRHPAAVLALQRPALFMDPSVVLAADQAEIFELRRPVVRPKFQVMAVAPGR